MIARRREKAWRDFAAWCRQHGLRALPAHPWTLAAYTRWCEPRHRYPEIVERVKAIARVHLLACVAVPDRHPLVTGTLRTLEMRSRTRAGRAALFPAHEAMENPAAGGAAEAPAPPGRTGPGRAGGGRRQRSLRSAPPLISRRPNRP
ncbi:MAG: hypothetical protein JNM48_14830 [Rhodospirillales bacterium]|nr:hypothetical protein [Rhodospirillales bacterium]